MRRDATIVLAWVLAAGCEQATLTPTATVSFPDPVGTPIPYRRGGQFAVALTTTIDGLHGSTHATVSIRTPTTLAGASAPLTFELTDQGDGVRTGTGMLAWPAGGAVELGWQVAGVTLDDPPQPTLVVPDLAFHPLPPIDQGLQWSYPYCVEATTEDGTIALHLEQGTLVGSGADAMLALSPGPCGNVEPLQAGTRSHATFTLGSSSETVRGTGTMAPSTVTRTFERPPLAHAAATLTLSSPNGPTVPDLAIVEVRAHVEVGGVAAAGIAVTFQATPADAAVTPSPATTNAAGDAIGHFRKPPGPVRIDAVLGSTRAALELP